MKNQSKENYFDRDFLAKHLDKSLEQVVRWQNSTLDELVGDKKQFVICGAGGLGQKVLRGLRAAGLECVSFADKNSRLWGTLIDGVPVVAPDLAVMQFKKTSTFVMSTWGAYSRDRMSDRKAEWIEKGCNTISFLPLFWKYPQFYLPHYSASRPSTVYENRENIFKAFDLLNDSQSRSEFVHQIMWRSELDYPNLPAPTTNNIYFPKDLLKIAPDEVFVDCGAYIGDTLAQFLERTSGNFKTYIGLEPDRINYQALSFFVEGIAPDIRSRIKIEKSAVGEKDGSILMSSTGLPSSTIGSPAGTEHVTVVSLDTVCKGMTPTYVKMDIEGFEMEALRGGMNSIRKWRPKLAIAAYHFPEHLWDIPNYLSENLENYNYYMRPHDLEGWDVVLYAIPREQI